MPHLHRSYKQFSTGKDWPMVAARSTGHLGLSERSSKNLSSAGVGRLCGQTDACQATSGHVHPGCRIGTSVQYAGGNRDANVAERYSFLGFFFKGSNAI
jgi:hypothetical protein